MKVVSIGVDRSTRKVGAILAERVSGDLLFVPLDRAGAVRIAGARRAASVDPGLALLLGVVASLGARLRHVVVSRLAVNVADQPDAPLRAGELVLTDASKVRCDLATALALSVHAGVAVHVADEVPRSLLVPAGQGRERYTAAMSDPVEQTVDELRRVLAHATVADFDVSD